MDIPHEALDGVARLLYALMGDVDVRIRWRAAHAVRCLARLGDSAAIDRLVELWGRTVEPSYRRPDAPFYWLAARLWLIMTLDRVAGESPSMTARHVNWLLGIAVDEGFPHVLVREFAKSAVSKLLKIGHSNLDQGDQRVLSCINMSSLEREAHGASRRGGFGRYTYRQQEDRRFTFDTMDTLPYWYAGALEVFADVSEEDFLNVAEHWIVDRWNVWNDPSPWAAEPRKNRLSDRWPNRLSHSHGARLTLERFHTYLEWHAMWCAVGELMRCRALAAGDDYDSLEHWLSREGLTAPPLWLADLRGMKPLAARLWYPPRGDIDAWLDSISNDDFLAALGWPSDSEMIVVASREETRSSEFTLCERTETALVSPDTASALVRALQTISNSWDYRIPLEKDDMEINAAPYRLLGWLAGAPNERGIDEQDPLRYEVEAVEHCPGDLVTDVLGLECCHDDQVMWIARDSGNTVFVYEAWGDNPGDEHEDSRRYDKTVRSTGWRLLIDKQALSAFLNEVGFDLVVEVEITRRNRGYDNWRSDEEKTHETRFDKVFLLRGVGSVEDVEACLGAWATPRT